MNHRTKAAQRQYESEDGFSSYASESNFRNARTTFCKQRTEYYLANPIEGDLDVLSYDDGQILAFINNYPNDPLAASDAFYREVIKQAERLAQYDADDSDYHTIMAAL